jgi:hypothetical protein
MTIPRRRRSTSWLAPTYIVPLLLVGILLTVVVVPFLLQSSLSLSHGNGNGNGEPLKLEPIQRSKSEQELPEDEGVSACLLVMDDNHFLTEWLAYHYHVANLRHVILTSDPNSLTSPTRVLDRWRSRMTIDVWDGTNGTRFLPSNFDSIVDRRAARGKDRTLQNHRARQAAFNLECLRTFKRQHRGWVMMIDTDEYLGLNEALLRDPQETNPKYDQELDVPPIEEPGSVHAVLQQMMVPHPQFDEITTACVPIYRRQFAARESPVVERVNAMLPEGYDGRNFQTLRWRKHGYKVVQYLTHFRKQTNKGKKSLLSCGSARDVPNKVIIDLGRLRLTDLFHPDNSGNPHRPLDAICPKDVYLTKEDTPLVANHYMGTREQWLYRVGDKRGKLFLLLK